MRNRDQKERIQVKKRWVDFVRSKFQKRWGGWGVWNREAGLLLVWSRAAGLWRPGSPVPSGQDGAAGARGPSLLAASEAPAVASGFRAL